MVLVATSRRKLHIYLALAQLGFAGFEILSRIALTRGTHPLAFTFYRNCVASIVLIALAAIFERKSTCWTFRNFAYFSWLSFLGIAVNQVCYMVGLKYTSAIFASAMRNCTPVFTFALAAVCKIESVNLRNRAGQYKLFGTALGLCGSLILFAYKGPVVIHSNISVSSTSNNSHQEDIAHHKTTLRIFEVLFVTLASWQIGAIFLAVSCLAFASFLILQAPVLETCCAPITFAAITCVSSLIQMPLLEIICGREWNKWRLSSLSEIVSIGYAGVVASGLVSSIQSWGVLIGGPVIVAAYQPLETICTALLSIIFLKESLHLGSVLGGGIVITGLYLLIWGQEVGRQATTAQAQDSNSITLNVDDELQVPSFSESLQVGSFRRHSASFSYDLKDPLKKQLRRLSENLSRIAGNDMQDKHHLLKSPIP